MIPPIIMAPRMTSVQLPPFLADAERKLAQQLEKNGGREERDEGRTSACSLGKGRRRERVTRALEVCSLEERLAEDRALTITSIDRRARKIFGARTSSGVIGSTVD
jgi:hypothetical protein